MKAEMVKADIHDASSMRICLINIDLGTAKKEDIQFYFVELGIWSIIF